MAPDLPIGFVQRTREFEALRALLLDGERKDPVAITTALTGAGGFGKTTLGETPDLTGALAKPHAGLSFERPQFKDAEGAATTLAERLERKSCLIVIDDVWDPAHLRPFLSGGEGCAWLITSRLLPVATEAGARPLPVASELWGLSCRVGSEAEKTGGPPGSPAVRSHGPRESAAVAQGS